MAHFAELDSNNKVLRVVVVNNDDVENNGGDLSTEAETWVEDNIPHITNGVSWKQCSYNKSFRRLYPGIGYYYNSTGDIFHGPQPYSSWTLNTASWNYEAPVTYPSDVSYIDSSSTQQEYWTDWDEDNQRWIGYEKPIQVDGVWKEKVFAWDPDTSTWSDTGTYRS